MDWYDKFKRFLGLPGRQESLQPNDRDRQWQPPNDNRREEFDHSSFSSPGRSFNVFTDPLEIHRYFEQQMSEMLRSFGFGDFGDFGEDGFSHQFNFPEIEDFTYPRVQEIPDNESYSSGQLRDQFLKPGYEKAESQVQDDMVDRDIDGKLDIRDFGSVFKGERQVVPKTRFFGQSVTTKTVRNPDGSVETHHTVRDNKGNEETTVTRKVGDKEYTITKRRDKEGKEEIIENLVNLDEEEVDTFFPKQQSKLPQSPSQQQDFWPFFDRFFK